MNAAVYMVGLPLMGAVVGATPFGYLAGKAKGIDIREHGSGNIGATNVIRVLGKGVGLPVFVLDVLKGAVPVWVAIWLLGMVEAGQGALNLNAVLTGLATILGHNYTFWLGFKGGKGVATSAGTLLALMPLALSVGIVVWVVFFIVTRYVAIASILSAAAIPVVVAVRGFVSGEWNYPVVALAVVIAVMVAVRHRSNIARLKAGTENRFERKKKKEKG